MALEHSHQKTERSTHEQQPSLAALLSRLINDGSALVRSEVALAKAELSSAASNAKVGAAELGVALVVLLAGVLSLTTALILGLTKVIEPWLAALIVGIALSGIGFALLQAAMRKIKAATPRLPRTQDSLQADAAMLARRI